jgi:hypothetical protein
LLGNWVNFWLNTAQTKYEDTAEGWQKCPIFVVVFVVVVLVVVVFEKTK